jgi:hypothetical protein
MSNLKHPPFGEGIKDKNQKDNPIKKNEDGDSNGTAGNDNRHEEKGGRHYDGCFLARLCQHILSEVVIMVLPQDGWH